MLTALMIHADAESSFRQMQLGVLRDGLTAEWWQQQEDR